MFNEKAEEGNVVVTVLLVIKVLCPHCQAVAPKLPTIPTPAAHYTTSDNFSSDVLLIPDRSALLFWNLVKPRLERLFFREKEYSMENLGNMTSNFLWSDHTIIHITILSQLIAYVLQCLKKSSCVSL